MNRQWKGLSTYVVFLVLICLVLVFFEGRLQDRPGYTRQQFEKMLEEGEITSASIQPNKETPTGTVEYYLADGTMGRTQVLDTKEAETALLKAGVLYEILEMRQPGFFETYGMSLILCGLMIFFIVMTMGRGNGGGDGKKMEFGKRHAPTVGGGGEKNGIFLKTAVSLEAAGRTEIVVLDKTGTITQGQPKVTEIVPAGGIDEDELLALAAALESPSEHPLATAIVEEARNRGLSVVQAEAFTAVHGRGVQGKTGGASCLGGNRAMMEEAGIPVGSLRAQAEALAGEGKTPMYFANASQKRLLGLIAVADVMKEDSPKAIEALRNMGMKVVMLTGDNQRTAQAIGRQAGVDEVIAGVLPDGKESVIRRLKEQGRVAMVGDGINDAPALTRADIGIAIGAGTDVAIDAADVVLMHSRLSDVPAAIRLSRAALRNIHQNLFWAFFYNIVGIPLAMGLFIPFGLTLNPMFGAAAMSLSSFCVVSNALRLNLFNLRDGRRDRKMNHKKHKTMEESTMEKTMKIEGMMCGHCEARVKKALEALPQVESAQVSHETGSAVVTLNAGTPDSVLKEAVEAQDYKVLGIE